LKTTSDNVQSCSDTISISSDSAGSSDSSEHHELWPLDEAKRGVWQYFGFPAQMATSLKKDKKKHTCTVTPLAKKEKKKTAITAMLKSHYSTVELKDLLSKACLPDPDSRYYLSYLRKKRTASLHWLRKIWWR